jgi:hypothetical protein
LEVGDGANLPPAWAGERTGRRGGQNDERAVALLLMRECGISPCTTSTNRHTTPTSSDGDDTALETRAFSRSLELRRLAVLFAQRD